MNTDHDPKKDAKHAQDPKDPSDVFEEQEGTPPADAATEATGGTNPETGLPNVLPEGYPADRGAPLP